MDDRLDLVWTVVVRQSQIGNNTIFSLRPIRCANLITCYGMHKIFARRCVMQQNNMSVLARTSSPPVSKLVHILQVVTIRLYLT